MKYIREALDDILEEENKKEIDWELYDGESLEETSPYTNIKSNGIYSLNTGWVKRPVQQEIPDLDEEAFEKLFTEWEDRYFDLIKEDEVLTEDQDNLTEYFKGDRRYYIRPQNIFCSSKEDILKALIKLGNKDCTIYTLKNLKDNDDLYQLGNRDIIYYYHNGMLYDNNKVKVMDYDLLIKNEENRKRFINIEKVPDEVFDQVYQDRLTEFLKEDEEISKADKINDFISDLYDLRKTSIANEGEYGLGNLVFKEFRNLGYLDNLKELRKKEITKELSLEQLNK